MTSQAHSIGAVALATGCKVQTIRYYEEIGLIAPNGRTSGNQRRYDRAAIDRLSFIRHARDLGFTLDQVRDLLTLTDQPDESCGPADRIAEENLAEVERRIAQLQALGAELRRMLTECRGGRSADCRILEVLGDHQQCLAAEHGASSQSKGRGDRRKKNGGRRRPPP